MNKDNQVNILLGNGFNIALQNILPTLVVQLDYDSIFSNVRNNNNLTVSLAEFLDQKNIDSKHKIKDIEKLLRILQYSIAYLKFDNGVYFEQSNNDFERTLKNDFEVLKKITIEALTDKKLHPGYAEIFDNQLLTDFNYLDLCKGNLKKFNRIYSLNYDLILYWLINHGEGENKLTNHLKDGFCRKDMHIELNSDSDLELHLIPFSGTNNNRTTIHFLHGALHLLDRENESFKIFRGKAVLKLQELRDNLLNKYKEYNNLIVFDSTSSRKLDSIYSNSYLTKVYDKLTSMHGILIIYGCKMTLSEEDNDEHLWRKILNSNIKSLYIGRSPEDLGKDHLENSDLVAEAEKYRKHLFKIKDRGKLNIYCFNQNNHNIWKDENFHSDIIKNNLKPVVLEKKLDEE
jgi:hypothetical protein